MIEGFSKGHDAPHAGDYNDQTRHLLQMCIHLMPLDDKQRIHRRLDELV